MKDWADIAAEREQEIRDDAQVARMRAQERLSDALAERLKGRQPHEDAELCAVCEEPIPAARREALPGVQTCVYCQADLERALQPHRKGL